MSKKIFTHTDTHTHTHLNLAVGSLAQIFLSLVTLKWRRGKTTGTDPTLTECWVFATVTDFTVTESFIGLAHIKT